MIGNHKIQCLCCNKPLNLLSVEPDFYCRKCVNLKEIHNSENGVNNINPIKWYSKISNDISLCQSTISKKIHKIDHLSESGFRQEQLQMRRFRMDNVRKLIARLASQKSYKIATKKAVLAKQEVVKFDLRDVHHRSSFTIRRMAELTENRTALMDKISTIQTYLNKLQCIFVGEIFSLFPITLCKYEQDKICNLPFHIELSDSSVLESNDSTASAILLLTILATSVTFILDICYSAMDIKQFAFRTICHQSEPLKRDEIMCVYRFLVRTVHHMTQSTLYRMDMSDEEVAQLSSLDSMALSSADELSADNYPLKKLVVLRDNLTVALQMRGISNPYVLKLTDMFQNEYINDFAICSKIQSPIKSADMMDFVELSSIIPLNELPSIYRQQMNSDNPGFSEWLSWVKSGFI